jgi:hypothetical protein
VLVAVALRLNRIWLCQVFPECCVMAFRESVSCVWLPSGAGLSDSGSGASALFRTPELYSYHHTARPELVEGSPCLSRRFKKEVRPFDKLKVSGGGEGSVHPALRPNRSFQPKPHLPPRISAPHSSIFPPNGAVPAASAFVTAF